ncbi:hypothetical protein [Nonomuraea sp. KM88]|uniref:hypothetical protein n=1 Tax=Nonomuraea sp. KM88 TaxID=3457427 RepID=UPI003FCE9F01
MAIHIAEIAATEIIPADTETAVAIPADAGPVVAPDGPDAAAPDTDPAPDADGRVTAVWAALNAEPGGSATVIGAAAGLSRMVAGKILNQFKAEERARREPGVNDGQTRGRAADRWYPITVNSGNAASSDTIASDGTARGTSDVDMPETAPAVPDADATGTASAIPDADAVPAPEETLPDAADSADPAPAAEPTGEEDLIEEMPDLPEDVTGDDAPGEGTDRADDAPVPVADADTSEPVTRPLSEPDVSEPDASGPVSEPTADDPAWVRVRAELAELSDLFGGVALAKAEGNDVMALGCLEMAMARVASVHREARAVLTGTAAAPARPASGTRPGTASASGVEGGVRPGALRDRVHAHLLAFPGKDFTPYEIGKVLEASSGAVANALDRLVSLEDAVLTCERPRRFALAPTDDMPDDASAGSPAEPGHTATDTYDG